MARRLVCFVTVERAGDDLRAPGEEAATRDVTVQVVLRNEQPTATLACPVLHLGRACCIELWLTAHALCSGLVRVEGEAHLHKSHRTLKREPEDVQAISFSVPHGRTAGATDLRRHARRCASSQRTRSSPA